MRDIALQKSVLSMLYRARGILSAEEIIPKDGDVAAHQRELCWLLHQGFIVGEKCTLIGNGGIPEVIHAQITPEGEDYLSRDCTFETPTVIVKLDEASTRQLLIEIIERVVKDKKQASSAKMSVQRLGDKALDVILSKGFEQILTHIMTGA